MSVFFSHNLTIITNNILKMSGEIKQRIEDIVSGTTEYPVKSKSFWLPNLDQIASYVEFELKKNYSKVLVHYYYSLFHPMSLHVTTSPRWRLLTVPTSPLSSAARPQAWEGRPS